MAYNFKMDTINNIQVNPTYNYLVFLNNPTINPNIAVIIETMITIVHNAYYRYISFSSAYVLSLLIFNLVSSAALKSQLERVWSIVSKVNKI
jgi:hypothetical protein